MKEKKYTKILVANRGEIALRIIRTLKEMDIKTVAVYSEEDKTSAHVIVADEAICIGPATSKESYLNIDAIIAAAKMTGAEAIHPGYGFLSENADFAKEVKSAGIDFIGPSAEAISKLGQKAAARTLAIKAGVPVIKGSDGIVKGNALLEAKKIGFPLMIKAALGGGGRGMRIALTEDAFETAFETAKAEAKIAFNNDDVYFEQLLINPRHIEVQFAADNLGNVIAFAERDCSMQRKNQKLIEESPSPFVTTEIRKKLINAAVTLIKQAKYSGIGTVEFLMDENKNFYFMEVNTRLQVEHPVTEAVCGGVDLVKMQVEIAQNQPLTLTQSEAQKIYCHAIEFRINAEDYEQNFLPNSGLVTYFHTPDGLGIRVDSAVYGGYEISSFYDSLIAKLIVSAPDRNQALKRAQRALDEFKIKGPKSTLDFHKLILQNKKFQEGQTNTALVEEILNESKK